MLLQRNSRTPLLVVVVSSCCVARRYKPHSSVHKDLHQHFILMEVCCGSSVQVKLEKVVRNVMIRSSTIYPQLPHPTTRSPTLQPNPRIDTHQPARNACATPNSITIARPLYAWYTYEKGTLLDEDSYKSGAEKTGDVPTAALKSEKKGDRAKRPGGKK